MTDYEQIDLGLALEPLRAVPTGDTIQETFEAFHAANPWAYSALVRLARQMVASGATRRIGIGMLFEVLRWDYSRRPEHRSSPWALNNNLRSRYARLIAEQEPDLAAVFERRELRSA